MKDRRPPLYLVLLPIYFVLYLFTVNISSLQPVDLIRPVFFSILLVGILYGLWLAVLRNKDRAALLTLVLWSIFSMYGHIYSLLKTTPAPFSFFGKHSLLGALTVIITILLVALVLRTRSSFSALTKGINIVLVGLILFQLVSASYYYIGTDHLSKSGTSTSQPKASRVLPLNTADIKSKPDIYYIILDAYSREDVIRKNIGIDTTPFLNALRQKGFYIGTCSTSNYPFTEVSLTSSLNMGFVQNIDPRFVPDNQSNSIMEDYIVHSKVRETLENLGYRSISFETGFSFTEWKDANEYLAPATPSIFSTDVRPFETLWLKTTALRALFDTHPPIISGALNYLSFPFRAHLAREEYLLDTLPKLASQPGPKFVFAHVIIPHVPLIFRADGSITTDYHYFNEKFDQPVSSEYLIDGYKNQVEYINARMLAIVDEILKNSKQPPIIIIQGDHGLQYYEVFPILNAYYLPGNEVQDLYPSISPVNTFTVIFNKYFGAHLSLLPDNSYFSTYTRPYDFQEMTEKNCPVK